MGYIESIIDGANKVMQYILGEKIAVLKSEYNFKAVAGALRGSTTKKYTINFDDGFINIKKKSILLSPSHYAVVSWVDDTILFSIKMNRAERLFVCLFVGATLFGFLMALGLLVIDLFIIDGAGTKVNAMLTTMLISVGLIVWVKIICAILAFLSGVSKPYRLLNKLMAK